MGNIYLGAAVQTALPEVKNVHGYMVGEGTGGYLMIKVVNSGQAIATANKLRSLATELQDAAVQLDKASKAIDG